MAVLRDRSIRERLGRADWSRLEVLPQFEKMIQPASFDVQLGMSMKVWDQSLRAFRPMMRNERGVWVLQPGNLYLGVLLQFIRIPEDLIGRLEGKSSLGRLGIQLHRAGIFDPGWMGCATTEMDVMREDEEVWPGMLIGQVILEELDQRCEVPYGSTELGSHYQGDTVATESRLVQRRLYEQRS